MNLKMTDMNHTNLSFGDLPKLKKEYKKAVAEGKESFTFKGGELLTDFAKYCIEYLEGLKPKKA